MGQEVQVLYMEETPSQEEGVSPQAFHALVLSPSRVLYHDLR